MEQEPGVDTSRAWMLRAAQCVHACTGMTDPVADVNRLRRGDSEMASDATLRDYFAADALASGRASSIAAEVCYIIADAMLAERAKVRS